MRDIVCLWIKNQSNKKSNPPFFLQMHGEIQALSAAEISDDLVTQKLSGSKYDMAGGADEGAAAHRTRQRKG